MFTIGVYRSPEDILVAPCCRMSSLLSRVGLDGSHEQGVAEKAQKEYENAFSQNNSWRSPLGKLAHQLRFQSFFFDVRILK